MRLDQGVIPEAYYYIIVIDMCLLRKFEGGLQLLHCVDNDALS